MTLTLEHRLGVPFRLDSSPTPAIDVGGAPLATLYLRRGMEAAPIPVGTVSSSIGSDPGNDVVIAVDGVAPRHGRLDLRGGVWSFTNIAGSGRTWIDGEPAAAAAIVACGSELRLGEARLVFSPSDDWRAIAAERSGATGSRAFVLPERQRPWWPRALFVAAVCGLIALAVYIFRTL